MSLRIARSAHKRADGRVERFTFAELCEAPLGAGDYLAVAGRYHTVVLSDIRAPIFAVGFLKQYAVCVGLDPEDVILRYRRLSSAMEVTSTRVAPSSSVIPSQGMQKVSTTLCSGNGAGSRKWPNISRSRKSSPALSS